MSKNLLREVPGLALTGARYLLAENIARRVQNDQPIGVRLAAFIAYDILDGAILRLFDADTPVRRVADGAVDHASMLRVGTAISQRYPEAKPYAIALGARAVVVGALNAAHYKMTGEVTKGQSKQRATNLATAAMAQIATYKNERNTHLSGLLANGIAYATIPTHLKDIGKTHEGGIRKL
ncbi:TPA: hypothetical protein DIV49_00595 [Candidatus Saccharibacteria bacterium]|nr:hypothetical protein [Candidatus Saccharibacteria bacterium]HRJ91126.1 hypothetical protein [Candidatus Saccharibacteria bacterium]